MIDAAVAGWLHDNPHPLLTPLLMAVTLAHNTVGLLAAGAALGALLWRLGRRREVMLLAVSLPGVMLLNLALKQVFRRARPVFEEPLLALETYSFPSGHAAGTTVLYAFAASLLLARARSRAQRLAVVAGAAFMVLLVGFSRVYLGVHWPSDVAAGIAVGAAWLLACKAALRRWRGPPAD